MSVPTMSLNAIYEACLLQGVFRITSDGWFYNDQHPIGKKKKSASLITS
jgi:hypothetical protein